MKKAKTQRKKGKTIKPALTAEQKAGLLEYILERISPEYDESADEARSKCDNTLRLARKWIRKNKLNEKKVLKYCEDNGGFCDCEILLNMQK